MKKTISIIYRICYILFSFWAFGLLFLPEGNPFPILLLRFPPFVNVLGIICIIPLLIMTIKGKIGNGFLRFKGLCAFLSIVLLITNINILTVPNAGDWIMCCLLPAMIFFDWLFFDKKGSLSGADPFIWLGILALLGLILFTLLKNVFNLPNALDLWGLFKDKKELTALALKAVISGAVMYALDSLMSGKSKKSLWGKLAFFWRLLFLILEGWALFAVSAKNLTVFVKNMADFTAFANFLGFLCILAVLIYNLIRYSTIFKKASGFPRVKGIFTFILTLAFLEFILIANCKINSNTELIFYVIGPIMMLLDWIIFDKKGEFRIYEPFIWLVAPVVHFLVMWAINGFYRLDFLFILKELGVLLVTGLIIFIIDRILKRFQG